MRIASASSVQGMATSTGPKISSRARRQSLATLAKMVGPRFIIIRGIPTQDPAQVRLPKYDNVVETFPSDRADQPLDVRVLPRRSGSSRLVPNAHGTQPLPEDQAIRSVSVPNKITR